jgi:hypothetical protein
MIAAKDEISAALRSPDTFDLWLAQRGYVPAGVAPAVPKKKSLVSARHFHAPAHPKAPSLLVLWQGDWTERFVYGSELRGRQRDANDYRDRLRAASEREIPSLCLLACHEFVAVFELNGDPFARRLRFSPDRLSRPATPLEECFRRFGAETFEKWAREAGGSHLLDDLLGGTALTWDFSELFVGSRLDEEFVAFMGQERWRIAELLLDPKNRKKLLVPMWEKLRQGLRDAPAELPRVDVLVRERRVRSTLLATVDTVLLRIVLYRYLEAQFGYRIAEDEKRQIAFGSYDDLVDRLARVDRKKLEATRVEARRKATGKPVQLGLFAQVTEPETFAEAAQERADWYQREAGGDLHQGAVAEAATVLQTFLLEHRLETFAQLLAVTSTSEYSFHYADLDPRAFQELYQQTIGTDLHVSYDVSTGKAEVGVVNKERNRKEQGAYYTDEQLSRWLVERSLGRVIDRWEQRFEAWLKEGARRPEGRLPVARAFLDELLFLRVVDPTCGGGIFLRAAFELLSNRRERVMGLLVHLPADVRSELTSEPRYRVFDPGVEMGAWEWHILLHVLYGVDVDVKAINVASNLLTLSALTYKRNGICFPSFINTSLKPGNALVSPVRVADRAAFADRHGVELAKLIDLRDRLRNPQIERETWSALHAEAAKITAAIVHNEVVRAYGQVFPDESGEGLLRRVMRTGVFAWEAEMPEVFFDVERPKRGPARARLRENPGFDVVIGNPPWEEPAAEYKKFLPEFDPEYLDLSGPKSKAREEELLSDPVIRQRWEDFCASVEDHKALLTSGEYEHQRRAVKGKLQGSHTNLYKYATERAYQILRDGGHAGLVLDGGLWSDLGASGLRALLLDRCSLVEVCGFINSEDLFPDIDNRSKFSATAFQKGGQASVLRGVFRQEGWEGLAQFEQRACSIFADDIRRDTRDSYPVPEVRSVEHLEAERALRAHPMLDNEPWNIDILAEELNAGRQRTYFRDKKRGDYPVLQGQQFNLFGVHQGELPDAWIDPSERGAGAFVRGRQTNRVLDAIADHLEATGKLPKGSRSEAAMAWVRAVTGKKSLPAEWVRLDWEGYRLAWRDIARNDDRRTLICSIVPRHVALTDKAPYVRPFSLRVSDKGVSISFQFALPTLLYVAGMLSSLCCDATARTWVAKTQIKPYLFKSFPVPTWRDIQPHRRIAELTARLTCLPAEAERPWADYTELAAAVGLTPERDGLTDPAARWEAEVELNALAAQLYGVSARAFRFLMDTLFMTPRHKDTHARMRDAVAARLPADPPR